MLDKVTNIYILLLLLCAQKCVKRKRERNKKLVKKKGEKEILIKNTLNLSFLLSKNHPIHFFVHLSVLSLHLVIKVGIF